MSRREWIQMSHNVRVPSETTSSLRRELWKLSERLQQRPGEGVHGHPAEAVPREEGARQRGVPAVHQRQEPRAHERHLLGRASNDGSSRFHNHREGLY